MIAAAVELPLPAASVSTGMSDDDDVPEWSKPCVAAAIDSGVVYGEIGEDGNRVFRANDGITVAEAAAVINRALRLANDGREVFFSDKEDIPAWALRPVINTFACGIIRADADNAINAKKTVTRAEAAKMLCAMLEVRKQTKPGKKAFLSFGK